MTKAPLTMDEHGEIEDFLRRTRAEWHTISIHILNAYPQTSQAHKVARQLVKALDAAKTELEEQMFQDHPEEGTVDVYYGNLPDSR